MKIEKILCGLVLVAEPLLMPAWADFNPKATCPVMKGEPVKKQFYVDYQGHRTYLCCRSCVKSFKENPEKYLTS